MSERHILINDAHVDYAKVLDHVMVFGQPVAGTLEVQAMTIELTDPRQCLVKRKNAAIAIGAAEALQLIGGFSDPAMMVKISPNFANFLDGGAFHGAYGPRIRHQLQPLLNEMRRDPDTRRGRLTIWNERDIATLASADYPCTLGFTFQIRNGCLDMHTHMRSNDAWWGWTYDVFQFCMLQLTVARLLKVGVGTYFHHADSFHIYDRDIDAATAVVRDAYNGVDPLEPMHGIFGYDAYDVQQTARDAFYGENTGVPGADILGAWITDRISR